MAASTHKPQEVVPLMASLPADPQEQTIDQVRAELERLARNIAAILQNAQWRPCKNCGVHIGVLYVRKSGDDAVTPVFVNHDFGFHTDTCEAKGKDSHA